MLDLNEFIECIWDNESDLNLLHEYLYS